jgi:hypothetical protein
MSKKISTYAKKHPFVWVPWELLNSVAYKKILPTAGKMLPVFIGKVHCMPQNGNYYRTEFEFFYSEAERLGVSRGTFKAVIRNLVEFGFLDIVTLGDLRGRHGTSSKFRLSDRWKNYDTPMFKRVDLHVFEEERIRKRFQGQVQFLSPISAENGLDNKGVRA